MTIEIIPRSAWGARPPRWRYQIDTPTPELWLHHTAGNHRGAAGMRAIQNFHMDSQGWSDIAYSIVVDRIDLKVYEGRGAGIAGGHTRGHNRVSHAICVMGNFETLTPLPELLDLLAELVTHGHTEGWWPDQFTGGHRDASGANTLCPGRNLYARIPDINRLALKEETTVEPDPLVKAAQLELLKADPDLLPRFGADGIFGQETAGAIGALSHRYLQAKSDAALLGGQLAKAVDKLDDIRSILDN